MHKIDAPGATANNRFTEGDPAAGVPATEVSAAWLNAVQSELVKVIESAGLTLKDSEDETGDQLLGALQALGLGGGQFQDYSSARTYETGETCRGSDGHFYEFYDRDLAGTVQGVDPTDPANRPHIWMKWDGVRPGTTIAWRSETLPEGYLPNDGWQSAPRQDYRRIFEAFGTTWGEGDGLTTFGMPGDEDEFLRGWDPNGSRGLAEHQNDAFQGHWHALDAGLSSASDTVSVGTDATPAGFTTFENAVVSPISDGENGTPRIASETRPRNNAVIWLTKI